MDVGVEHSRFSVSLLDLIIAGVGRDAKKVAGISMVVDGILMTY